MEFELHQYFLKKLKELEEKDPEYNKALFGSIMLGGASAPSVCTTLYDALEAQINYQAKRKNTSPKNIVDTLFLQSNADEFMQLL